MILAIIAEKDIAKEITELLFTAKKERYVIFNFRDAKSAVSPILKNLRISSSLKYGPFKTIVKKIEESDKIVLVNDGNKFERGNVLREMNAHFLHINCFNLYREGDLYMDRKPKSVKDVTEFINIIENYISNPQIKIVDDFAEKEKDLDRHYQML